MIFSFLACKQKTSLLEEIDRKQIIKDSLTVEIKKINEKHYFNGMGVAIVDSTGVLYENGIGFSSVELDRPYTVNTVQPIASVSKTFIGVALLIAQEKKLLNLDDSINKYLPFQVKNPHYPNKPITIRQLATHTSSIVDTDNYMNKSYVLLNKADSSKTKIENIPQYFNASDAKISLSEFLENYISESGKWYEADAFTKKSPGEFFEYTNIGASLAAYIIEITSNMSYADFSTEYILKPLKMNRSGWSYDDVKFDEISTLYANPNVSIPYYSLITYPDGGLLTTVNDLGKYLAELIKGYSGKGTLLSQKSYKELFQPQLQESNFTERNANHPYNDEYNSGIFMGISATGNIGHTGGDPGVSTLMFFNSKSKIGRILIVNTNIENQEGTNVYYKIFDKLEEFSEKLKE